MINTKQRAYLRSLSNKLEPCVQIGKEGAKDNTITTCNQALQARELIKIKVLQNCDFTAKEVAKNLSQEIDCDVVQVIGNKIVLYKRSDNDKIHHLLEE